jgi:hypothetical protein
VIIVWLTRLVAIDDVSQFDYFRHLASAASTTAVAPALWPRSERPLLSRRMWYAEAEQRSRRTLREFERSPCYADLEHLQQSADCRHTRQAEGKFGIDARNPTQVPNTIGDLLLIDHLLLRFKPKYSPPGLTPGSALALLLVPPKCSQRYPLDFALGLIWPSTSRSGVGLPFALQPVCTRAGLVIKRLPFRGVWAARRHSLPGVIKILRDLVDIAR